MSALWPCPECGNPSPALYGPSGQEVCLDCYDDLAAYPDMGTKARPKGWYATHHRDAAGRDVDGRRPE
jgi:hypothetical protein